MAGQRKSYSAAFKAQVALAARKGDKTIPEWKRQLLVGAEGIFANGVASDTKEVEARQLELYARIGRLKMELEWVKNKAAVFS